MTTWLAYIGIYLLIGLIVVGASIMINPDKGLLTKHKLWSSEHLIGAFIWPLALFGLPDDIRQRFIHIRLRPLAFRSNQIDQTLMTLESDTTVDGRQVALLRESYAWLREASFTDFVDRDALPRSSMPQRLFGLGLLELLAEGGSTLSKENERSWSKQRQAQVELSREGKHATFFRDSNVYFGPNLEESFSLLKEQLRALTIKKMTDISRATRSASWNRSHEIQKRLIVKDALPGFTITHGIFAIAEPHLRGLCFLGFISSKQEHDD